MMFRMSDMNQDLSSPKVSGAQSAAPLDAKALAEHSRLGLKAARVGTWTWCIDTDELIWSDLTYQLFGVDPHTFQPSRQSVENLVHPEDRGQIDQQVEHCLQTGGDFNCEYRIIWPNDESIHYLRSRGQVLLDRGEVRLTGACWDITERRVLEEQLAHERFLLRTLMQHLPDRIYFKDRQSRFIRVSDEMARCFGVKEMSEILGKTDFDFFSDEHAQQAFADEQRILHEGEALLNYEEHETWPDGREGWVSTTKVPLIDAGGQIIGTFGLSRDITERRRAEAQLARYAEELRRRNRDLEEDLEMARELQGALMPRHYPSFSEDGPAGPGSALRFSHIFTPSAVVSGDFFDIIKLSDTAAGIFICDVMGHGVRAALVAAIVRALIGETSEYAEDPGAFLKHLNQKLYGMLSQSGVAMFASASYVVADIAKGELRYANAGHPEPLCIRHGAQSTRALSLHRPGRGPVLGMFDTPVYETSANRLSAHDVVLQFTDGLYEVEAPSGELYDEQRLVQAVNRRVNLGAGDLCREVLAEIRQFSAKQQFTDDVCLVAVEVDRLCA